MRTSHESKRGCGYRKPGGLYLVTGPGLTRPCGKLPIPLTICPTCSHGIKPTRGTTWIEPLGLGILDRPCDKDIFTECPACPLGSSLTRNEDSPLVGKHLLIWIGGSFYPKPSDWIAETKKLGASRRIPAVPNDFELGKTWVYVAHRDAIPYRCECFEPAEPDVVVLPDPECPECKGTGETFQPAIFHLFKPDCIEYVVDEENDDQEKLERLEKRGIELVKVIPIPEDEEQPELPLDEERA
jgi:hypothetical protein